MLKERKKEKLESREIAKELELEEKKEEAAMKKLWIKEGGASYPVANPNK